MRAAVGEPRNDVGALDQLFQAVEVDVELGGGEDRRELVGDDDVAERIDGVFALTRVGDLLDRLADESLVLRR